MTSTAQETGVQIVAPLLQIGMYSRPSIRTVDHIAVGVVPQRMGSVKSPAIKII